MLGIATSFSGFVMFSFCLLSLLFVAFSQIHCYAFIWFVCVNAVVRAFLSRAGPRGQGTDQGPTTVQLVNAIGQVILLISKNKKINIKKFLKPRVLGEIASTKLRLGPPCAIFHVRIRAMFKMAKHPNHICSIHFNIIIYSSPPSSSFTHHVNSPDYRVWLLIRYVHSAQYCSVAFQCTCTILLPFNAQFSAPSQYGSHTIALVCYNNVAHYNSASSGYE